MLEQVEVWVVVGVLIYTGLHTVVSYATAEPRSSAPSPSRSAAARDSPPAGALRLVSLIKKILKYFPPVILLQVTVVHLLLRHSVISGRYLEGHTLGGYVLWKAAQRLQSIRKYELAMWVLRVALLWNRLWLGEQSAAVARTYRELAVACGLAAAAALPDLVGGAAALPVAAAASGSGADLALARYQQLRHAQHNATARLAQLQYARARARLAQLAHALLRTGARAAP